MAIFGYGYTGYLPEMKGLTDIQKQDYADQMARQRQLFTAGAQRQGGFQSSGAYLSGLASLLGQEARGMNTIEKENQLKNAMLAREERLAREAREWQKQMSDINFERQRQMLKEQQNFQAQQALWQGLGGLAGMGLNFGLGYITRSPLTKMFENMSPQDLRNLLGVYDNSYASSNYLNDFNLNADYSFLKNFLNE